MRLKAGRYDYFYEFSDEIVKAAMKEIIAHHKVFQASVLSEQDKELVKAAKLILKYYS